MQNSDNTPKSARPNLMAGMDVAAADNASILNTLDGAKRASPKTAQRKESSPIRNKLLIGVVLTIGLGTAFYAFTSSSSTDKIEQSTTAASATTPTKDVNEINNSPTQTAPQTAVIEDDGNTSQSDFRDPKTKLTESLEAGLPVSGTSLKTALESPKKIEKPVKSVDAERVPERKPTSSANTKRGDKAKAADRDVNILTALVGDEKASAENKNNQAAKSKTTPKQNAKQTKAKHEEDGPDIVERRPGDSTAGLLNRCKKLGFVEGELCRWRICSGRWDTDSACKPQQSSAQ